jgi:hypothetical protein
MSGTTTADVLFLTVSAYYILLNIHIFIIVQARCLEHILDQYLNISCALIMLFISIVRVVS